MWKVSLRRLYVVKDKEKWPCHGTKKRWRGQMLGDQRAIGMKGEWYRWYHERKEWHKRSKEGVVQS